MAGTAAVITTAMVANEVARQASAAQAASEEKKAARRLREEAQAAHLAQQARSVEAEKERAKLSGKKRPGPGVVAELGGAEFIESVSAVVRKALESLSAAHKQRSSVNPLASVPMVGDEDSTFVCLCAAMILGEEFSLQDLLDHYFSHPPVEGFVLQRSDFHLGLSCARLSEASAQLVVDFLVGTPSSSCATASPTPP